MGIKKLLKMLGISICLCLLFPGVTAPAAEGKTVILYSGNIRGSIDVLPGMAALKAEYEATGAEVVLVDTGNYLQGTVYSAYDSGKTVIGLMEAAGYDVAAIGSHEFDFGTGQVGVEQHEIYYADDTLGRLLEDASFSGISANIFTGDGLNAFAPSARIRTNSGRSIGFFGITDSRTVDGVLESNLAGLEFRSVPVEEQAAALSDCDLVVGLSNEGNPAAAEGVIMIDIGSEAGFTAGALIIDNETGEVERVSIDIAEAPRSLEAESAVEAAKAVIDAEYPDRARATVTLEGSMLASRTGETNTGNLWTDALLWFAKEGGISNYYDEDEIANGNDGIKVNGDYIVALWNGGNLRDYLNTGDVTLKDIQRVLPYPNRVAVVYLTGEQLLEMLEAASQALPYGESPANAAFLHSAGLRYTVNTVIAYDAGAAYGDNWYRANSIRRVTIDSVNGNAFDPTATYAVITSNAIANGMDSNYICLEKDAELSTITNGMVVDVVWMYIRQKLNGVIGQEYAGPQGRITILAADDFGDVSAEYRDDVSYVIQRGLMWGTPRGFEPDGVLTRGEFVNMLYRLAGSPPAEAADFADVAAEAVYAKAVGWAYAEGIANGMTADSFAPEEYMTCEQMAVFIHGYYGKPSAGVATGVSDWAGAGVAYARQMGYMPEFDPKAPATRIMGAVALAAMGGQR